MLQGALSEITTPNDDELAALTETGVRDHAVFRRRDKLTPADAPIDSPIPGRVGDPSPIKHVFYVIRENRTYDQVFGDIAAATAIRR